MAQPGARDKGGMGSPGPGAPSGVKKFVLRPYKQVSTLDQAGAVEVWVSLRRAIDKIHSQELSQLSFEELYRFSYNLVVHKHGELLYNGVVDTVQRHLARKADTVAASPDSLLLSRLREAWGEHCRDMSMIRDILLYMEKSYVAQNNKRPIYDEGAVVFKDTVLRHAGIRGRVQRLLLEAVATARRATKPGAATASATASATAAATAMEDAGSAARSSGSSGPIPSSGSDGDQIDLALLRAILLMLCELGLQSSGVYQEEFEARFIADTAQFYHDESNEFLAHNSVSDYIRLAERRLKEEYSRAHRFLPSHPPFNTLTKLGAILTRTLIGEHAVAVTEAEAGGVAHLLERDQREELGRMYRFLSGYKVAVAWTDRATPAILGQMGLAPTTASTTTAATAAPTATTPSATAATPMPVPAASPTAASSTAAASSSISSGSGGMLKSLLPSAMMRDMVKAHVLRKGVSIVTDGELCKDPVRYTEALLGLRAKHVALVDQCFEGDKDMAKAVKEAFELFLNLPGDKRPAEYLSIYLDEQFRSGFRSGSAGVSAGAAAAAASTTGVGAGAGAGGASGGASAGADISSEADVDELFNACVLLFRFLSNKDEFEEWYKAHLQKRLLGGKSASDDAERLMIAKLKSECGFQFTSKLEGMFNDLKLSQDMMAAYKADKEKERAAAATAAASSGGVDVEVTVLTSVNWPAPKCKPCRLPAEALTAAEAFRAYYLAKHVGRRLTWHTEKGTAELILHLGGGKRHELIVSTFQMCALVLFNTRGLSLPFSAFEAELDIPREELQRHLLSLATPKLRILNKSSKGKDIDAADVFTVNTEFSSKLYRLKVPLVSLKSLASGSSGGAGGAGSRGAGAADEEGADVATQLENQRKNMMEAAIVRIMKSRKTLDHANLVAEVTRQLASRFKPSPTDIKKRIESLIERDYLERDNDDKKILHYLA